MKFPTVAALEIHKLQHLSRFEIRRKRKLSKRSLEKSEIQVKKPAKVSTKHPENNQKSLESAKMLEIEKIPDIPKLTTSKIIRSADVTKQVSPLIRPLSEALSAVASISQE